MRIGLAGTSDFKSVWDIYFRFINEFENEQNILTELDLRELLRLTPERVGLGVERMRKGNVKIVPGHDGCFGQISLFEESVMEEEAQGQLKLF